MTRTIGGTGGDEDGDNLSTVDGFVERYTLLCVLDSKLEYC